MALADDNELLLCGQRALLGQVTPEVRSVSGDIDLDRRVITFRCEFSRKPSESEWDAASDAVTGIMADYLAHWTIEEDYPVVPMGEKRSPLRLVLYMRCEDDWVKPPA